jgi:hypothetical protein
MSVIHKFQGVGCPAYALSSYGVASRFQVSMLRIQVSGFRKKKNRMWNLIHLSQIYNLKPGTRPKGGSPQDKSTIFLCPLPFTTNDSEA